MMVKIKKQLVSSRTLTYGNGNPKKSITIHETDNFKNGANAQMHANLQSRGNSRRASWHWQVDDKEAIQSFPHSVQCWHAADGHGPGNTSSIAIEICVNSDGDYQKAVENAIELTKHIMKEEDIPASNVVQHNRWCGKNCPRYLRSGSKGPTWSGFVQALTKSGGHVDYKPQTSAAHVDKPKPTTGRIAIIQKTLNSRYHTGITVDNLYGPKTKKALVKGYQTELNRQFGAHLAVDGIWGPKTKAASVTVRKGARGNLTWILQATLYCLGYDPKGLDGIFGSGCEKAVRAFQGDHHLSVDGVPGKNTFAKMFS